MPTARPIRFLIKDSRSWQGGRAGILGSVGMDTFYFDRNSETSGNFLVISVTFPRFRCLLRKERLCTATVKAMRKDDQRGCTACIASRSPDVDAQPGNCHFFARMLGRLRPAAASCGFRISLPLPQPFPQTPARRRFRVFLSANH